MFFKQNPRENIYGHCNQVKETVHLVEECQLTSFQEGFTEIHKLSPETKTCLSAIKAL